MGQEHQADTMRRQGQKDHLIRRIQKRREQLEKNDADYDDTSIHDNDKRFLPPPKDFLIQELLDELHFNTNKKDDNDDDDTTTTTTSTTTSNAVHEIMTLLPQIIHEKHVMYENKILTLQNTTIPNLQRILHGYEIQFGHVRRTNDNDDDDENNNRVRDHGNEESMEIKDDNHNSTMND
jgi:hypothetical protein